MGCWPGAVSGLVLIALGSRTSAEDKHVKTGIGRFGPIRRRVRQPIRISMSANALKHLFRRSRSAAGRSRTDSSTGHDTTPITTGACSK